jgi:hypothetical protein
MITERAMLAAVHIRLWTASKHDKRVSQDVAQQHGAQSNVGRYHKHLLQGAAKLDAIQTLGGQVRQHFYKVTLPWSDEGYRILPAHLYFDLASRMRAFETDFARAVDAFVEAYPVYIERMRPALNSLFRDEDYPDPDTIRSKFSLKLEVIPIPSGDDFRVALSEEQRARIAQEIDQNVRTSLARGTRDLWTRLREVVAHMMERLSDPKARLHASVVDNVIELVELLPRLNVVDDAQLLTFTEEVRGRLCNHSSRELRESDQLRSQTAREAAEIAERISTALDQREEVGEAPEAFSAAKQAQNVFDHMSAYLEAPAV